MAQYTYCPDCNHEVETIEVSMGTSGGGTSLRCIECGKVLAEIADKFRPGGISQEYGGSVPGARVITAGYSGVQNDLLIASLMRAKFADSVEPCANGEEFLKLMTRILHNKEKPRLVVLEVQMAIMNGINSALCLRSIEKGIGKAKVPILFFTRKPLDDMFSKAIKFLTPAKYVPLPKDADAEIFRNRADQVAELLLESAW